MDGAALAPEQFSAIARLPGVDALRGQLVGLAASPLSGVVRTLNQLLAGLAQQLGQVAEQGLVSGAAPDTPAADAPEAEAEAAEDSPRPRPTRGSPRPRPTRLPKAKLMRLRRRAAMTPTPTPGMRRRTRWQTHLRPRSGSRS